MKLIIEVKAFAAYGLSFLDLLAVLTLLMSSATSTQKTMPDVSDGVAVGSQYDSTHVYVTPADLDALVSSATETLGDSASRKVSTNVLPVPSN